MTSRVSTDSVDDWSDFLGAYAHGRLPTGVPPLPPRELAIGRSIDASKTCGTDEPADRDDTSSLSSSLTSSDVLGCDFDHPVYTSVEITPAVTERVRRFYGLHSFLPPPRAPLEFLREQCILEYDLYSERQTSNVQAATDLVQAFFGGIVTFTLFKHSQQELIAISGPKDVVDSVGLHVGKRLLPETSLCGHTILFPHEKTYIPDLARDWRYSGNPYADELKGVKSYLGSVVSLNVDPASLEEEQSVPVGVINLMHLDDHMPPLNPGQDKVIEHIKDMLQTQLRATWEGHNRSSEAKTKTALSQYLEDTLVQPLEDTDAFGKGPIPESPDVTIRPDPWSRRKPASDGRMTSTAGTEAAPEGAGSVQYCAQMAARRIRTVLGEIDTVAIIDVRGLHIVNGGPGDEGAEVVYEHPPMQVLGWDCGDEASPSPNLPEASASSFLNELFRLYMTRRLAVFERGGESSGFERFLPRNTQKHVCIPIYAEDDPLLAVIASTSRPYYPLRSSDTNFIRSMSTVLRARIMQSRLIEADAAKTAFLSSISHELRTPMHGLLSGLQLAQDAAKDGDHAEVDRLLAVTEASGQTLELILNDVLDFGTWTRGGQLASRMTERDLARIVWDTAGICLPRMLSLEDGSQVDLVVEMEDRDWSAVIDEVGFQRMLLNGITNAIKFTKEGRIVVRLTSSRDNKRVLLGVIDDGPGLNPTFASKAFDPFTKADPFSAGAGLGLHISRMLAERMSGSITLTPRPDAHGAIFQLDLPVVLRTARPASDPHVTSKLVGTTKRNEAVDRVESIKDAQDLAAKLEATELTRSVLKEPTTTERLRVLVVEDNDISRKILVTMFKRLAKAAPLELAQACDGVEAVETFEKFKPHLVLTDVSMPRMDGITAAAEMRRIEREWGADQKGDAAKSQGRIRIYAITGLGSSDPRLKMESLKGGAELDGWLIKGQDKLDKIKAIVLETQAAVL